MDALLIYSAIVLAIIGFGALLTALRKIQEKKIEDDARRLAYVPPTPSPGTASVTITPDTEKFSSGLRTALEDLGIPVEEFDYGRRGHGDTEARRATYRPPARPAEIRRPAPLPRSQRYEDPYLHSYDTPVRHSYYTGSYDSSYSSSSSSSCDSGSSYSSSSSSDSSSSSSSGGGGCD